MSLRPHRPDCHRYVIKVLKSKYIYCITLNKSWDLLSKRRRHQKAHDRALCSVAIWRRWWNACPLNLIQFSLSISLVQTMLYIFHSSCKNMEILTKIALKFAKNLLRLYVKGEGIHTELPAKTETLIFHGCLFAISLLLHLLVTSEKSVN